jgi:23S rRNA U2552 (ribose-2'-O)-methylase RlmE/FtsJ
MDFKIVGSKRNYQRKFPENSRKFNRNKFQENKKFKENPDKTSWDIPMDLNFYVIFDDIALDKAMENNDNAKNSLNDLKDQISNIWPDVWRRAIESNWVLGRINQACELKPYSRAFYKFIELSKRFPALSNCTKTAHLGEAPGGFFQAYLHQSGTTCDQQSHLVSLPGDNWPVGIPPNFIHGFNIVEDKESRDNFCAAIGNTLGLVTADGGFEVPPDKRREQEIIMLPLLQNETDMAFKLLQPGGNFVLKLFAIDLEETRCILFQLMLSFNIVYIVIPMASKPTNDERYAVCLGFKLNSSRPSNIPQEWKNWFNIYCMEDKLRQRKPIIDALELSKTLTSETRIGLEPGLSKAKSYCASLGLPIKNLQRRTL